MFYIVDNMSITDMILMALIAMSETQKFASFYTIIQSDFAGAAMVLTSAGDYTSTY